MGIFDNLKSPFKKKGPSIQTPDFERNLPNDLAQFKRDEPDPTPSGPIVSDDRDAEDAGEVK